MRIRTRKYERREAYKRCSPHPDAPYLEQNDVCYGEGGERCDISVEESEVSKYTVLLTGIYREYEC